MDNYHDKAAQSSGSYRFSKVHAGWKSWLLISTQGKKAPEAMSEECHIGQLLKHLQLKIKEAQKQKKTEVESCFFAYWS